MPGSGTKRKDDRRSRDETRTVGSDHKCGSLRKLMKSKALQAKQSDNLQKFNKTNNVCACKYLGLRKNW